MSIVVRKPTAWFEIIRPFALEFVEARPLRVEYGDLSGDLPRLVFAQDGMRY